jgi:hypothetical protein
MQDINLAPCVHSKFRGDADAVVKSLEKKGLRGKVLNRDIKPRLEFIDIDLLEPLETQRWTKGNWIVDRHEDIGGFDMVANGVLEVARDPDTGRYGVWNGCGRLGLAQTNGGIDQLPCVVYDLTWKRAAFYFAYNQDRGRRTLSKESIFVNAVASGDEESVQWESRIGFLGLYVKGDTDHAVPHPQDPSSVEIRYRSLVEGYKLANGDMALQRHARDMIFGAWSRRDEGCPMINQDLYWAVIVFLRTFPDARKNGMNRSFQKFLDWLAEGKTQSSASKAWKDVKGLSGNSGVSKQLALGLAKAFREYTDGKYNNSIVLARLQSDDKKSSTGTDDSDTEE